MIVFFIGLILNLIMAASIVYFFCLKGMKRKKSHD